MRCFFHPNLRFRVTWDLIQVLLLLYLLIIVPLRIAFDVEIAFGTGEFYFDMMVDAYFLVPPRPPTSHQLHLDNRPAP